MHMKRFSSKQLPVHSRLSRRSFLRTGVAVGGGLLISINAPVFRADRAAADTSPADFAPSAFIRIDKTGQVTAIIPQSNRTRRLYVDADADRGRAGGGAQPDRGGTRVGGRQALRQSEAWIPGNRWLYFDCRVLRAVPAGRRRGAHDAGRGGRGDWRVDASSCRAENGTVFHDASSRSLPYGEVAAKAATLPVPEQVALKDPKDFKIIGTLIKRRDSVRRLARPSTASISCCQT